MKKGGGNSTNFDNDGESEAGENGGISDSKEDPFNEFPFDRPPFPLPPLDDGSG